MNTKNINLIKGILGGAGGRSVSLLAPFLVMPIMLNSMGESIFGLWLTILSLTSMIMFMDLGIGNGLLTKLSYENGLKNYGNMKSYIASGYFILGLIALFSTIIVFIGLFFLKSYYEYNEENIKIILITLVLFLLGIPVSFIQKIMYAKHEILSFNLWQIVGSFFSILLCYLAVYLELKSWLIVFFYSFPLLGIMVLNTGLFFYRNKELIPKIQDFSKERSKELLGIGSKFFILSIITSISLNLDNLLIATKISEEMVVSYSIPAKVASLLGLVVTTLYLPLWSANGDAFSRKDYDWVVNTTKKMMVIGGVVILILSFFLNIFNEEVIRLWMKKIFYQQDQTIFYLCILSFLMAIVSPWFMVLNSLGKVYIQIKIWLIYLFITFILKYYLLNESNIWIIAMINAFTYAIIIVPVAIFFSKKAIEQLKSENS